MIRLDLSSIAEHMRHIARMESFAAAFHSQLDGIASSLGLHPETVLERLAKDERFAERFKHASDKHIQALREMPPTLDEIQSNCERLPLPVSKAKVERMRRDFDENATMFLASSFLASRFKEIGETIEDELKSLTFMFVPPDRAFYFGDNFSSKWPQIAEDVSEASKCLGSGRYTAAVFYLMRVMERGVGRFAKLLNRTINTDRTWGEILRDVKTALASLPGAAHGASSRDKEHHERLSEIAAYLHHVKVAWRNTTMHPKRTYTQEEAEEILRNVKAFVKRLTKLRG